MQLYLESVWTVTKVSIKFLKLSLMRSLLHISQVTVGFLLLQNIREDGTSMDKSIWWKPKLALRPISFCWRMTFILRWGQLWPESVVYVCTALFCFACDMKLIWKKYLYKTHEKIGFRTGSTGHFSQLPCVIINKYGGRGTIGFSIGLQRIYFIYFTIIRVLCCWLEEWSNNKRSSKSVLWQINSAFFAMDM